MGASSPARASSALRAIPPIAMYSSLTIFPKAERRVTSRSFIFTPYAAKSERNTRARLRIGRSALRSQEIRCRTRATCRPSLCDPTSSPTALQNHPLRHANGTGSQLNFHPAPARWCKDPCRFRLAEKTAFLCTFPLVPRAKIPFLQAVHLRRSLLFRILLRRTLVLTSIATLSSSGVQFCCKTVLF